MVIIHLVFGLDQEHSGDELELTLWWKPLVLPGVPGDLKAEPSRGGHPFPISKSGPLWCVKYAGCGTLN